MRLTAPNTAQAQRALARKLKALEKFEIKVSKAANRNVARRNLTSMVKFVSKSTNVKAKAIRGDKLQGKANQWKRVKLFTPSRASNSASNTIYFNVTPIAYHQNAKVRGLKRGGVKSGKHGDQNGFAAMINSSSTDPRRSGNPRAGYFEGMIAFKRQGSNAYPLEKITIPIERKVKAAKAVVKRKNRQALPIEYEKQKRRLSGR